MGCRHTWVTEQPDGTRVEMRLRDGMLRVMVTRGALLAFLAEIPHPGFASPRPITLHNQLRDPAGGTERVIDGRRYTVACHGGTATVRVPATPPAPSPPALGSA